MKDDVFHFPVHRKLRGGWELHGPGVVPERTDEPVASTFTIQKVYVKTPPGGAKDRLEVLAPVEP